MKRIIALILSLITLLTMCTFVNSFAEESYSGAHDFLKMLGILEEGTVDFSAPVSRGLFCDIAVKSLGQKAETSIENPFSDLGDNYIYRNAVLKAYEMGLVSGNGRNRFEPEKTITLSAAVKILVEALGYSGKATYLGGFPTGHIMVASEIELIRGISNSGDAQMNLGAIVNLIYNFLNTDLCMVTDITASNLKWETVPGRNPLTEYFDLKSDSGIIKAAGFKTMIPQDDENNKRITVDAKTYKTELSDIEKYLGKDAVVWYDENEYVRGIYVERHNSSVTINAENVDYYSNYNIYTFDKETGKEAQYSVDRSFSFVKNGRNHIPNDADFKFPEGELVLIDNNGDGKYDVVLAEKYEYMVVSSLNPIDCVVYDNKNGGKSATLKNEDGYYCTLQIANRDGSLENADIKNLAEEMVLMLKKSDDGKYVTAVASKLVVGGVVSEIDNDNVLLNGTWYKFNSYFFENAYISPGKSYNFLIAPDKTITALAKSQESSMNYGYLIGYHEDSKGLSKTVQISVMTESGKYIYPYLSDNVVLDGKKVKKTDKAIKDTLTNGALPKYQLIKYQLDDDKNICKIDTSKDASKIGSNSGDSALFDKYTQNFSGDDTLTRFLQPTSSWYYWANNAFTGHAVAGSSTVIMSIPYRILDGATEPIAEEEFSLASGLDSITYTIETYDVGKEMEPGVILLYYLDATAEGLDRKLKTAIVDRVAEGLNEDMESIYYLYLWQDGTFYKYPIKAADYAKEAPLPGDIIRYKVNSDGEIYLVAVDARYDAEKGVPKFTATIPMLYPHDVICYFGTSFTHTNASMTLLLDPNGLPSGVDNSKSSAIIDGITPLSISGGVRVGVFDTKTKSVRPGNLDMITDAISVGRDNATKILVKADRHVITEMYIYE